MEDSPGVLPHLQVEKTGSEEPRDTRRVELPQFPLRKVFPDAGCGQLCVGITRSGVRQGWKGDKNTGFGHRLRHYGECGKCSLGRRPDWSTRKERRECIVGKGM